jgi:release factor glutamine methyltransferase
MKIGQFLQNWEIKLKKAGISTARLDTLILLEDVLQIKRAHILAHPEIVITAAQFKKLNKLLTRRAQHEPLAYIRGVSEFYGRKFKVNRHVLDPRPESETMIDLLKQIADKFEAAGYRKEDIRIADIGTGSGALGITAALELHNQNVDLFDIDASALAVAKHNCALHELHLKTAKRDLLKNTHKAYDVILANLPYVPDDWQINKAASKEPKLAIFGGKDGLDVYRRLFEQLSRFSWRPKYVLTESLPPQHKTLAKIAKSGGFKLVKSQDFIQVFKARSFWHFD